MVFSPLGSQITISLTLSPCIPASIYPIWNLGISPHPLGLLSEGDSIKHSNSPFRKMFIKWLLLAETSKAAHICPFPADNNVYDFYFPNPQFKSRWEGMSQREIPLLLADDSSVIICIFPNLQNVNILEKKMQTFHISFLMRFLVVPSHPTLLYLNHWHLAISLSI